MSQLTEGEDYYIDEKGLLVFTKSIFCKEEHAVVMAAGIVRIIIKMY